MARRLRSLACRSRQILRPTENLFSPAHNSPLRNETGLALLITLLTLSLLVVITLQFHKTSWLTALVSHNQKTATQLKMVAESGIEIGFAALEYDGRANSSDSFLDPWANIKDADLQGLFPEAALHLEIIDLAGRLPVNSLVGQKTGKGDTTELAEAWRRVLLRLLTSGAFAIAGESQARQLVDSLVDWVDVDSEESDQGAETSYYRSLDPPYDCRNGRIHYMEELLLVKGMTPELLFGSDGKKPLADYLTVFGNENTVNINTAPSPVIKAMSLQISDELVAKLDAFRRDPANAQKLKYPAWYKNIGGWPDDLVLYEKLLTTRSNFFQIHATGHQNLMEKQIIAVVQRKAGMITLLFKKVQ